MDLTQITIAQSRPENQFVFDADQFDQEILRAEERRGLRKHRWSRCRAFLIGIGEKLAPPSKLALRKWIA